MGNPISGRVVVVTGATSGIGRATALALAERGDSLLVVARDPARGRALIDELRAKGAGALTGLVLADLGVLAEVRQAASEILDATPQIDVLLNNAGVVHLERKTTQDGFEATFAVNHLAYFLLTLLLLPRLRESAPSRIVSVASDAHRFVGGMQFDDLGWERATYRSLKVYGHSKLANILFTRELARRLAGSGVTAVCLHPGAVATGLGRDNGIFPELVRKLIAPFMRSPASGAATSIHLATLPDLAPHAGAYFANLKPRSPSKAACDDDAAARLWALSTEMCGLDARADAAVSK